MMVIPTGSFLMGSPADEMGREEDEDDSAGPGGRQIAETVSRSFAIGRFEVTWNEWNACVAEQGCLTSAHDPGWGMGDRPVIFVSWIDAQAYALWLRKKTGKPYRLPSEVEWEYAARAGSTAAYSFGGSKVDLCRCGNGADLSTPPDMDWKNDTCNDHYFHTAPVGSFQPNAFGLYDMHGNVWEWVDDCYTPSYPADEQQESNSCKRSLRGGSWYNGPTHLRSADRNGELPTLKTDQIGFRVALDLKQ
jgi:formylglycine-generating enzyme required for sulfatase activity